MYQIAPHDINIIKHHYTDDPDFQYDYEQISIEFDGTEVVRYTEPAYGQDADRKVCGFIDALNVVFGIKVTYRESRVSDLESIS